jgi:hypothetical protein
LDPVGSLIVVKYSVGVDGNGYSEKRRIIKNYGTEKGPAQGSTSVSTSGVVSRIIVELKPTIVSIIRTTVKVKNLYEIIRGLFKN